ncbi:MAG: hypothetical protein AAF636_28190 [Pseudomonadota bacterium]
MPKWMWFAPLGVLVTALGAWAFRLGWIAATISETDVIQAAASQYLVSAGPLARATDCAARPGQVPNVWIVVTCKGAAGQFDYAINRLGRFVQSAPSTETPGRPKT